MGTLFIKQGNGMKHRKGTGYYLTDSILSIMRVFILILFPLFIQAQKMPDTGKILADSNFICTDPIQPDSTEFNVKEICHSNNDIEIRLKTNVGATSELIILLFNNNKWTAEKYYPEYITRRRKILSEVLRIKTKNDSAGYFTSIFESLRSNSLFILPDQQGIKSRLFVVDGILYTVTFKVGNEYRRYRYSSPELQAKQYPNVPEYKQVLSIINLLNDIFITDAN
jgi:hypothetical protein